MDSVREFVDHVIPIVEAIGAVVILTGVAIAAVEWLISLLRIRHFDNEEVRLTLARYLVLGLEFQLAADILSTAVSPSLEDIARLAAIAAIRTGLNLILERDLRDGATTETPTPSDK